MSAPKELKQRDMTRTPGAVEEAIGDMALRGYTVAQIERELPGVVRRIAEAEGWRSWKVPHRRTIQRIVKRAKPPDPSAPWRIEDFDIARSREVLAFLAESTMETGGRVSSISRSAAEWVARLRGLAPGRPWLWTLRLALMYRAARRDGESTESLDAVLAFAPWESPRSAIAYTEAVLRGFVAPASERTTDGVPWKEWLGFQAIAMPQLWEVPRGVVVRPNVVVQLLPDEGAEFQRGSDRDEPTEGNESQAELGAALLEEPREHGASTEALLSHLLESLERLKLIEDMKGVASDGT